jgi:hypothetical protein
MRGARQHAKKAKLFLGTKTLNAAKAAKMPSKVLVKHAVLE